MIAHQLETEHSKEVASKEISTNVIALCIKVIMLQDEGHYQQRKSNLCRNQQGRRGFAFPLSMIVRLKDAYPVPEFKRILKFLRMLLKIKVNLVLLR